MKILRVILIILVVLIVIVGILTLVAPTDVAVSRSIVINAPREVVWNNVSRFENTSKWSPWNKYDPNMKVTLEGTDGTVGAVSRWEGNDSVGTGSQTISKLDPMNRAETHLQFLEPFESEADAYIQLDDTSGGTKVTWGFTSKTPRPMNIMHLFMDMDAMLGKDYEDGLNNLKTLSESAPAAAKTYRGMQVNESDLPARVYIGKRETVDMANLSSYYMENMAKVTGAVQKAGLEMAGMPSGLYWKWDTVARKADMTAAVPVKEAKPVDGYETINVDAGKGVSVDYYGSYEKIGDAHWAIDDYMKEKGMSGMPRIVVEEYVTGPMVEKDTAKWLTKIYYYL